MRTSSPPAFVVVLIIVATTALASVVDAFACRTASKKHHPHIISRHTTILDVVCNTGLNNNAIIEEDEETSKNAVDKRRELSEIAMATGETPERVLELLAGRRHRLLSSSSKMKVGRDEVARMVRHIDWLLGSLISNVDDEEKKSINDIKLHTPSKPATTMKTKGTSAPTFVSSGKSVDEDASLLSNIEFATRSDLHPDTKRALIEMGLSRMTEIQSKTFDAAFSGSDVLGRARTGTGKTIAFLLPAIERVLRSKSGHVDGSDVGVLVISPTRELATQIGVEATRLLTYHKGTTVQVVFGGTKSTRDVSRLNKRIPTVLVATPGRLKDLLKTASIGGIKFSNILSRTPVVVLDETDCLLDMGFRREIQDILHYVPRSDRRQMLLFSATIPKELKEIMKQTMKPHYVEVDCIQDNDGGADGTNTQTHIHVKQSHAVIPCVAQYVSSVIRVVREAVKDGDANNKIVVFFPTARMVGFFADLFNNVVQLSVMELHSRKSQGYRDRVSSEFREAKSGILFTSDVSARGVDYPGVSHVVQFGMPSSTEQYVHRLGRTGRAGAAGKGWLILGGPFETPFLGELKQFDVPINSALTDVLHLDDDDKNEELMQVLKNKIGNSKDHDLAKSGEGAYQAFLGYYLGQMKRLNMNKKETLVEIVNEFSTAMGFLRPPTLAKNMVGKMGLKGIPGISVEGGAQTLKRRYDGRN